MVYSICYITCAKYLIISGAYGLLTYPAAADTLMAGQSRSRKLSHVQRHDFSTSSWNLGKCTGIIAWHTPTQAIHQLGGSHWQASPNISSSEVASEDETKSSSFLICN